jgi:hypothetical protein
VSVIKEQFSPRSLMFSQKFTDLWEIDSNWKKFKKFWGEALIRRRLHMTDPNWSPCARVEYISNFIHTARIGSFSNTFHSTRNFCMNTIIFFRWNSFKTGDPAQKSFAPKNFGRIYYDLDEFSLIQQIFGSTLDEIGPNQWTQ